MLPTVIAISFLAFCRCRIPLHPMVRLSPASFGVTEIHGNWGVVVTFWGIGGVELVIGLLGISGAWVVVSPVLLEGAVTVLLVF